MAFLFNNSFDEMFPLSVADSKEIKYKQFCRFGIGTEPSISLFLLDKAQYQHSSQTCKTFQVKYWPPATLHPQFSSFQL